MVLDFFCLTYFSQHGILQINLCCWPMSVFYLFLWLSSIPLYTRTTSLSNHLSKDTGCFHVLATVDNASMNIGECITLQMFSSFSGRCPERDFWVIWLLYFQFFEEPPFCFPWWLYLFTFSPAVNEGSFCSTTSPTLVITCHVDNNRANGCEVISHCSFDLLFPNS